MTLQFLPEAEEEAAEATAYYAQAETGLGVRFREEVESVSAAILSHPLLWRQRPGGYRWVNLAGFPCLCGLRSTWGAGTRHRRWTHGTPAGLFSSPFAAALLTSRFLP